MVGALREADSILEKCNYLIGKYAETLYRRLFDDVFYRKIGDFNSTSKYVASWTRKSTQGNFFLKLPSFSFHHASIIFHTIILFTHNSLKLLQEINE